MSRGHGDDEGIWAYSPDMDLDILQEKERGESPFRGPHPWWVLYMALFL